jgi:hypothetical protein
MADTKKLLSSDSITILSLFLIALFVYWGGLIVHADALFPQSNWQYFTYYSKALLSGHLHFTIDPPNKFDLSVFNGKLYMHFPPFPSILFMPLVKLFGLDLPDRFFSVLLGSFNGVLFYILLLKLSKYDLISLTPKTRIFCVIYYLFGTVHFYLSITGNPWEFAHIVCNTLVLLSLIAAFSRLYAIATLLYVAILFTRTHIFLSFPILIGIYLWQEKENNNLKQLTYQMAPYFLIAIGGICLLLVFNYIRFEDALENGISYHMMHSIFKENFLRYGYFHWAYIPRNINALLIALPVTSTTFPFFSFNPKGLSIFIASPLYLYLFLSFRKNYHTMAWILWTGILLTLIPILLLMGTGEAQFGHRYTSDIQVFLILLVIIGMNFCTSRLSIALIIISILMNTYGAIWFTTYFAL